MYFTPIATATVPVTGICARDVARVRAPANLEIAITTGGVLSAIYHA